MAPRPTLVVIGSVDLDFVPLVVRVRERGIKTVCIAKRSKMAQDAVPACDQVMYAGGDQVDQPKVQETKPIAATSVRAAAKKTATKSPAGKTVSPKPAAPKKAVAKKVLAKKTMGAASDAVTVSRILSAVPNLKAGQWQPLGDVAKVLHDRKAARQECDLDKAF